MEAKHIELSEWEYFGEGGSSTSYINKLNGNFVLKLNRKDIPVVTTENEFLASKAFHEAGLPSPAIYEFVTDGERFGYTSQRIKGKVSYARTLSQEPGRIKELAGKFSLMAHEVHRTPIDVSRMTDKRKSLRDTMGDLSYVPEDVAEAVRKSFESISGDNVCLHGDMNPGNLITFEGHDKWIGVNEFAYGDPFLDIATLHILCHFLPSKNVSKLYHLDQSALRKFYAAFKKAYFGDIWNSKEVNAHIKNAAIVRFCAAAKSKPEYVTLLTPLVRGRKISFMIKRAFL